jgi:hypothetical protein
MAPLYIAEVPTDAREVAPEGALCMNAGSVTEPA